MRTSRIQKIDRIAALHTDWNRMSGNSPFRSWEWQFSWWETFSDRGELYLVVCHDEIDRLVGLAPLYLSRSVTNGRTLSLLGTGKACGEYLGFLSSAENAVAVQQAIADFLINALDRPNDTWDRIELESIDEGELDPFIQHMQRHRARVIVRPGMPCWRIALPSTWEDYYQLLSKGYRRKNRVLFRRMIKTNRARFESLRSQEEVENVFAFFCNLHRQRRLSLDGDNCFDTAGFEEFLSVAASRLAANGAQRFDQLFIDDQCAAIVFGIEHNGVYFNYLSGIDPTFLEFSPGWLLNSLLIKNCIEQRFRAFDLLRGNEPYKAHLQLSPHNVNEFVVSSPKPIAILRHQVDVAKERIRIWRGS